MGASMVKVKIPIKRTEVGGERIRRKEDITNPITQVQIVQGTVRVYHQVTSSISTRSVGMAN